MNSYKMIMICVDGSKVVRDITTQSTLYRAFTEALRAEVICLGAIGDEVEQVMADVLSTVKVEDDVLFAEDDAGTIVFVQT